MTQNKDRRPKTKALSSNQRSKTKNLLSAVILAAGQSRRMGQFKPLLPFGDKTVIESCLETYLSFGIDSVVVVLGHRRDEIQSVLKHLPIRFATNPDPASQMADSIRLGIELLPAAHRGVFISPADYPAVPSSVLEQLAREWQRSDQSILIPENNGRGGHPVLIDLSLRADLENLDPKHGLRGLLEHHRGSIRRVPVDSPFIARDLDTWDDYRTLHKEVFGQDPPNPGEHPGPGPAGS
jgi:molybdenum cofactor cytidylyltransferase